MCGKPGKDLDGKIYCGYHVRAARATVAKKLAELEKLMEKLEMSRDDVMKAWEGGEGSSEDVAVGVPVGDLIGDLAEEEEADETEEVGNDLD